MDSNKFIKELKECLIEGGIDHREIDDTIKYYEDYFRTEIRNGSTEDEILNKLGEPRLIAKTIIEASNVSKDKKPYNRGNNAYFSSYTDKYDNDSTYDNKRTGFNTSTKVFTIKNRFISALVVIGIILLLVGMFILSLKILYVLLPFILIYGLIRYILK